MHNRRLEEPAHSAGKHGVNLAVRERVPELPVMVVQDYHFGDVSAASARARHFIYLDNGVLGVGNEVLIFRSTVLIA